MNFINLIINRLEEVLVAVSLAVGTAVAFIEVVLRKGFGESLGFAQELTIYLMIFTGLIGSSIGVRAKTHIGVDVLVKNFPFPVQKVLKITAYLISALFCLIFTYLGVRHVQILIQFQQVTPEMNIPLYIPKAVVPFAFGLMTLRFLQESYKSMKIPAEKILEPEEGEH